MPESRQEMKHRWLVWVACLAVGVGCVYGSFRLYRSVSAQPLTLRVVPRTILKQRTMLVRLTNTGRENLVVNVGRMGYFLAVLDNGVREAVVQIQSDGRGADARRDGRVLRPGDSFDIDDIFPDVQKLPVGRVTLRAVYAAEDGGDGSSGFWRGVVHSPPLTFDVKRN
ncbi:MAG: hypothetical protein LUG50_00425 [Planctomycetaceae bacterium]|nr:hypothetical protein [Planctomycetaceae bacterium]